MDVKKNQTNKQTKKKPTKICTSAGSAARRCAHVKGEKLARWPYAGIELSHWYDSAKEKMHAESENRTPACRCRGGRANHRANQTACQRKPTVQGRRRRGRQKKKLTDNAAVWTGKSFATTQALAQHRQRWRQGRALPRPKPLSNTVRGGGREELCHDPSPCP